MRQVYVVFEVEALTEKFLAGKTAVVLDVLRATSSMIAALAAGATRVRPTREVAEAWALKKSLPAGTVVLGGERGGLQIEGFDVGNTPQEFSPAVVGGKTLVMTTTNGTRAILMSLAAQRLYAAGLVNVAATARALVALGEGDIVLVGSGTEREVSWEDTFAAGAIVERLIGDSVLNNAGCHGCVVQQPCVTPGPSTAANDAAVAPGSTSERNKTAEFFLTDSALIALEAWRVAKIDVPAALRRGRGGRNVMKFHLDDAFATCGAVDSIDFAARVHKEPLEIVIER